jgi:hypothetical protein
MSVITNRGTLVTAIEAFATFDQAAYVDYFIDWAHQEIGRRLRSSTNLSSMSATISTETIALPTRFAAIRRFYLDTSPRTTLSVVSPELAQDRISQGASQTYPEVVCVEGDRFRFAPTFTGSATGYCLFYQTPTDLSASTDTNAVLTKYPMLYLLGALESLYRFMEDDNNADRWGNQFGALIEDINTREAKDMMSGPMLVQVAPGGVV